MTSAKSGARRAAGRYVEINKARLVGDLARPAPSRNIRTVVGAVPNPLDPREMIAVTINRNTDILEDEIKQKLISEAAYRQGRQLQAAFEVSIRSSSNWLDGVGSDATTAQEDREQRQLDRARRAERLMADVERITGEMGAELLRRIIAEGWSYGQIAIREGKKGDRGRRAVAARFRETLEYLAAKRAARGQRR